MKLKHVVLTAIAATLAIGFASCGSDKNEIPAPTIKVKAGGSEVDAAKEAGVPFEVMLKTDDKTSIESVTFTWKYGDNRTKALTAPTKDAAGKAIKGSKDATININTTLFPDDATTGHLLIELKDKNNGIAKREQKVKVRDAKTPDPTPKPEPKPEDKPMMKDEKKGGFSHAGGTGYGAFNLKTGKAVSAGTSEKAENRYMINNSTMGPNKPFNAGWSSDLVEVNGTDNPKQKFSCKGNGTDFKLVNIDYAKATVEECETAMRDGTTKVVNDVKKDQVYVAKMGDELYILKITNVDPTKNRANTGMIEFVYKRNK